MLGPEWLDAANLITTIVKWFGPWAILGVMLVIFAETGLLIGFFLPGDSLLFTLGMFVGTGAVGVHIWVAAPLVWLAAVAGNQTGYLIGRKAGPAIFNRPDSRLFKQEHVDRTSDFFERHGGKAVTLAQFVPIVRTFTPVIAGVGKMHYRHFITFNVLGATFWAFGITWLGYFLGSFDELHVGYKDRSCLTDDDGERLICPASNGMFRPILVDRGRLVAVRPVGEGLLWKDGAAPSARVERDVNRAVSRMEQRLAG